MPRDWESPKSPFAGSAVTWEAAPQLETRMARVTKARWLVVTVGDVTNLRYIACASLPGGAVLGSFQANAVVSDVAACQLLNPAQPSVPPVSTSKSACRRRVTFGTGDGVLFLTVILIRTARSTPLKVMFWV